MPAMALLERERFLDALDACRADAAAGLGRIALVTGEAGIGKTSLLREFARRLESAAQRPRVLWGSCEALFTPHPLAPLYDIARQIGGDLPALIADAERRDVVFNAAIEALARGAGPTVAIIEDAHWADEATLDLIKFLGRRLERLGILLVISYRDDEVNPRHPLCSVVGDLPATLVRRVPLEPLSAAAVASLVDAAAGRAAGDAARLHEITGGNPFFVTEALAAAEDDVPPTVRDAVIARMARLSEAARAIVDLAALVPGRIEGWLLAAVTPCPPDAIQECLAIGMVMHEDGSLAFRHELARRAADDQVPAPQGRALHARILAALRRHGGIPATRLVHHADLAGDSAAVLEFAPAAAARAIALRSHREAAAHFATALRHADALPAAERAALFEGLAYECYLTEQIAEAIAARKEALALRRAAGDALKEGDNLRWLSRLSWFDGNKAASDDYARAAIACLSALPPGRELAMAYSNCAQLYMLAGDAQAALDWGGRAIALAERLGEIEILSHALNNVGSVRLDEADGGGRADLERSLRLALEHGLEEHAARAYTNLASTAVRHYQLERAARHLAEGIAYSEAHDLDSWRRYMTAFRAQHHLQCGDWTAAAADADSILRHSRAAAISRIPSLVTLALVRARRGDPGIDQLLDEAWALALPTGELQRIGPVACARAEAAWLRGRPETALADLRIADALAPQQPDAWIIGDIRVWLVRCGAEGDDAGAAPPFAREIAGDWRGAAAAWAAIGAPYAEALALLGGDEAALRRALEICERLGAAALAFVARRRLRASGVRGVARGAQERTRRNPQGLTTSELKVLALLVEGRRNAEIARRLFVSEKTVGHHVSAILGKLAVRSRGEAAAAAMRLGLAGARTAAVLGAEK